MENEASSVEMGEPQQQRYQRGRRKKNSSENGIRKWHLRQALIAYSINI